MFSLDPKIMKSLKSIWALLTEYYWESGYYRGRIAIKINLPSINPNVQIFKNNKHLKYQSIARELMSPGLQVRGVNVREVNIQEVNDLVVNEGC